MKHKIILSALAGLFSITSITAQYVITKQLTLNQEKAESSCFTSSKYYFKSFDRTGEKPLPSLEETVEKSLVSLETAKPNTYWMYKNWATPVATEAEADYTITGTYNYNSGVSIGEKVSREKVGSVRLPYFVTAKEHRADLDVIFTFEYKDGSPTRMDTISIHKKSVESPGKSHDDASKLEAQLEDRMKAKVHYYKNFINGKTVQINFPKVKIKDKALKAEYATLKDLLKEGEYEKAGSLVKKVYESNPTPELSQALGICYELVGNYPKAEEYYKALPDFHIKVRMKKNMALLAHARSMGYEPEFIEF